MIGRFIKVFWFFTLFGGLASLLYVYAGLSQEAQIYLSDTNKLFSNKEVFFYVALAILAIQNFGFYALSKNIKYKNDAIQTLLVNWFISFAGTLNILYIVMVHFIYLMNSGERVAFDNFGFLAFVALAIVIAWLLALPILVVKQVKNSN
ncbi:MAG: hypothetical protein AAGA02_02480 [Bacteroidota bacterium]